MKNKSLFILIALVGVGFLSSCVDLDLKPKGLLGEAELFGSPAGIDKYFAGIYGWLPIEDFLFQQNNDKGYRNTGNLTGTGDAWGTWEAQKNMQQTMSAEFCAGPQVNNDGPDFWRYNRVRDVNVFINNFPKYKSLYTDANYNAYLGEARFLRAFLYFGMVKRYGGVPIISEIQDPLSTDSTALWVKRNTEYDVYKFIYDDLKFASANMSSTPNKYRGTKWTALALQSRAMLYAATIAKYTQYLNYAGQPAYEQGLAGISPDKANEFFQYAYDAAKELIEKGPYTLYNLNSDLAQNFHDLFLDQSDANKETIFMKSYVSHDLFAREAFLIGHNWDALMLPNSPRNPLSNFVGSQAYPSLTAMRYFEGFPSLVAADGTPKRWDNLTDFKANMEPRMRGCMYFNGDKLRGITFDIRRGLYKTYTWTAAQAANGVNNDPPNLNGNRILGGDANTKYTLTADQVSKMHNMPVLNDGTNNFIYVIGDHGITSGTGQENNCLTGAYVRKYINETRTDIIKEHTSFQPWIQFRLAEVYLNFAEAAYELGKKSEANTYINKIRTRAGCKQLDISENAADVNQWDYTATQSVYNIPVGLQFIRDERYRELWGENQRWFDLRRWRVADKVLLNFKPRILGSYYILDEDKYILMDEQEMGNRTWNAAKQCYYQAIPQGEINNNNNLLPNNPFR